jgi:hypothetical protein
MTYVKPGDGRFELVTQRFSEPPTASEIVRIDSGGYGLLRFIHRRHDSDPVVIQAFRREMEANLLLASIKEQAVARLIAADEKHARWFVRWFSARGSFAERMRMMPQPSPRQYLGVGVCVLSVLQAMWDRGGSHGDPGPYNVLITDDGDPVLSDPVSVRRWFAEPDMADVNPALDQLRFLAWFVPSAREVCLGSQSDVARSMLTALGEASDAPALLDSLSAVARDHPPEPLGEGAEHAPTRGSGANVGVDLVIGPVADSRTRYWAAKELGSHVDTPVQQLRQGLETESYRLRLGYPSPARDLEAVFRENRCRVEIRRAASLGDGRSGELQDPWNAGTPPRRIVRGIQRVSAEFRDRLRESSPRGDASGCLSVLLRAFGMRSAATLLMSDLIDLAGDSARPGAGARVVAGLAHLYLRVIIIHSLVMLGVIGILSIVGR